MLLNNSYISLPERFYAEVEPAGSTAPRLLAWNQALAAELGLQQVSESDEQIANWVGGNELLPGSKPIAMVYAGHQFGNFVPQLGDGRAILLGDATSSKNDQKYDIQLKGAGQTPYSRNGDGRAALGPVIREYLVSEAMHRLGVPTTRALAAVETGEKVLRDSILPGGIIARVASSHVRVGTFEFFSARNDLEGLKHLLDYVIKRHCPTAAEAESPALAFYTEVVERQAALIAHWMDVGFIHGVMNTDNMAVSGETIDYGPCAFMDEFKYDKVFSSIDRYGRYAYSEQPTIAQWNLARLAECLLRIDGNQPAYVEQLGRFEKVFRQHYLRRMTRKLGLKEARPGDEKLVTGWLKHLEKNLLDFTLSFRALADRLVANDDALEFGEFEQQWKKRVLEQEQSGEQIREAMNAVNPLYIPRNHQIERAIDGAIQGDLSVFKELQEVLGEPFTEQKRFAAYAETPAKDERVYQTFCGT